jgi:hypothetical protein
MITKKKAIGMSVVVLTALAVAGLLTAAASNTNSNVRWDPKASEEVAHALHYMHEVWNAGDMDAVNKVIAGDDVLVTFELDTDNKTPVPLRSKKELLQFLSRVAKETGDNSEAYVMEMPKMRCRATADFGVCTEECTVKLQKNGKDHRVDKLFGTAVAVKYPDGWKWIQWHMSVAPGAHTN